MPLCRGLPEVLPCKKWEVLTLLPLYVLQCVMASVDCGTVGSVILFAAGIGSGLILWHIYKTGEGQFGVME